MSSITLAEFNCWSKYFALHDAQQDRRFGILAATLANLFRGKNKKPYRPEDFFPRCSIDNAVNQPIRSRRETPISWAETKAFFSSLVSKQ